MPPRLGALIAVVLWGASFVATRSVLREITPIALVGLRFTLAVAFLVGLLAVRRKPLVPPVATWPMLALMGFVGVFIHQTAQAYGLAMTSAMNTGWLIGLIPLWSAILAATFLRERFGPPKIVGLAVGFAGALLVVTRGRFGHDLLALPSTRGDLLIIATTVNWAVYTVLGHGIIRRVGPLRATAGAMFLGWVMLVPLFLAGGRWTEVPSLTLGGWMALSFLGIGCSGLGYLFWYGALEKVEAGRVASLLYLEPLVTLAAAVLLLGEDLRLWTIMGGILVLGGVALVQNAGPGAQTADSAG